MRMSMVNKIVSMALVICVLCGCAVSSEDLPLYKKDAGKTFQVSSHSRDFGDAWNVNPGETKILAEIDGAAIIQNMWFTCSGLPDVDAEYLRNLIIKMYWDDEKEPSVEVPFGNFFGCGFSRREPWQSKYVGVTSGGFYSYFPMPFAKSARIEIENKMKKPTLVFFHILGQKYDKLPKDTLYFHSQYRRENPTIRGKNYTILNAKGDGYFAGSILFIQGYDKGDKWNFLEGDEFMYVDGEKDASIKGTGGEDYFQGGWYFVDGVFNAPYHGLILKDHKEVQTSMYRFHFLDRVNFSKSIRVEIEHGNRPQNEAKADFSSVAFWYQTGKHQSFPEMTSRENVVAREAFMINGAIEWEHAQGCGPLYVSTYNGGWSNNMGANFLGEIGAITSRTFTVAQDGIYEIGANFIASENGAIAQVKIDGKAIGKPVDTYLDSPRDDYLLNVNPAMGHKIFGKMELKAGEHTAQVEIVGNNPNAKASEIMIDCLSAIEWVK